MTDTDKSAEVTQADIVERLRVDAEWQRGSNRADMWANASEAADTITVLLIALDRAREWIAHDDSPMGPAETTLHRGILAQIDAAIARARGTS